jgi:hypothetical protein
MLASERSSPPNQIGRPPNQVADHDAVGVPLANRYFVDTDRLRPRRARALQLRLHVLLVEFLDGAPVQIQFLGDILDGAVRQRRPTNQANRFV